MWNVGLKTRKVHVGGGWPDEPASLTCLLNAVGINGYTIDCFLDFRFSMQFNILKNKHYI
jgi:hypothetical protein